MILCWHRLMIRGKHQVCRHCGVAVEECPCVSATIQTISDVQPIPNADAIEKVKVLDWWCVAKHGEFRSGDACAYFEIDSLLPSDNSAFEFMDLLDGNMYWNMARARDLEYNLPEGFAIQGEIIGESIQGNPLKRKGHELYVFNVYHIAEGRYLNFNDFRYFCSGNNLTTVPIVAVLDLPGTVESIIDMADGKSLLNPDADREGLVFRPLTEQREEMRGSQSRLSFKAISNRYLLGER